MSGLLGLTLIAVVVTVCIFMLVENVNNDFPSMLIQLMWLPLAALWGASWILGWLS